MQRTCIVFVIGLASCGEPAAPARVTTPTAPTVGAPAVAVAEEAPTVEPFASVQERSGCAFESVDALCDGLREHYRSASPGWVSDGCALGEVRASTGPFAELRLVGMRVGYGAVEGDARVDHPVLGGSVREPPGREGTTQVVLAARIGAAWFPLHLFHPVVDGEIPGERVAWELDETGALLTWTDARGDALHAETTSSARTERTLAVVQRGVPMIAARATIDEWRSDVDLVCARACNRAPSPPPAPECSRRCASSVRGTRTWEQSGDAVTIGATEVVRQGSVALEAAVEEAVTRRLDAPDEWLSFCAFVPVVRAVAPDSPPMDEASVAARARGQSIVANGTFRALPGASHAAVPGAPHATIEIFEQLGTGCGGGGCTTSIGFRTIDGSMPERGIAYFADEHGARIGCDDATLPAAGASTFVEVAPAISREAIGCGLAGYDGTAQRHWVVVRVLEPRR